MSGLLNVRNISKCLGDLNDIDFLFQGTSFCWNGIIEAWGFTGSIRIKKYTYPTTFMCIACSKFTENPSSSQIGDP